MRNSEREKAIAFAYHAWVRHENARAIGGKLVDGEIVRNIRGTWKDFILSDDYLKIPKYEVNKNNNTSDLFYDGVIVDNQFYPSDEFIVDTLLSDEELEDIGDTYYMDEMLDYTDLL